MVYDIILYLLRWAELFQILARMIYDWSSQLHTQLKQL